MKNLVILALFLATLSVSLADDRVQIYLYFESLCPGCRQFITGSFKEAIYTADFDKICDYKIFPYGNAHQRQVGDEWVFTCQHGEDECYGNLLENCALKYIPFNENYKYVICLEEIIDSVSGWDEAAQQCATEFGIDLKPIYSCIQGKEGNELVHETADATDALNPPHKYVPWVTYDGTHTSASETAIENNMVQFACQNYDGPVQIAACNSVKHFASATARGAPAPAAKNADVCYRSTALEELVKALNGQN
jgi:interferon gamma-inducible protein 30